MNKFFQQIVQKILQIEFKTNTKTRDNVAYSVKHCKVCAAHQPGDANDCPLRGSFHGEDKKLFQPWAWVNYLIKFGYLSPLHWKVSGLFGYWSGSMHASNGITNAGRAVVSGLINGSGTPAAFTYIAVGTGTNAFAATDVALQTESSTSGLSRAAGTVSLVTTTITNDTAQVLKSFSVTGTVAVTESGLFNASSSVTLLCRQTFSAINVVNGDTLQVTWKIQNT